LIEFVFDVSVSSSYQKGPAEMPGFFVVRKQAITSRQFVCVVLYHSGGAPTSRALGGALWPESTIHRIIERGLP